MTVTLISPLAATRRARAAPLLCLGMVAAVPAATAGYGFDASFNTGYSIDAFAGSWLGQREGGKLVRLADGDIVVAGRMRLDYDPVAPAWNLGLVRYGSDGQRQTWTGYTGAYGHFYSQYLVYPNPAATGQAPLHIDSVDDIAYANGKLFVLVTHRPSLVSSQRDAALIVFTENGSFVEQQAVISGTADEIGVALDATTTRQVTAPTSLTVLINQEGHRIIVARLNEDRYGDVTFDPRFGSYGLRGVNVPGFFCGADQDCELQGVDLARPFRFTGNTAPIYIAASARPGSGYEYPLLLKLDRWGAPDESFNRMDKGGLRLFGVQKMLFGPATRPYPARAAALGVETLGAPDSGNELIWVVSNVQLDCQPGIGIARVGSRGAVSTAFGPGGAPVYGGEAAVDGNCDLAAGHDAHDLVVNGDELAVVGQSWHYNVDNAAWQTDGMLLRVDKHSGEARSLDLLPQLESGFVAGYSALRGIVASPTGSYFVSGLGDHWYYGSLYLGARLRPLD